MRIPSLLSAFIAISTAASSPLHAQFTSAAFTGTLTHDPGLFMPTTGGPTAISVSGALPVNGTMPPYIPELHLDTFSTAFDGSFSHAVADASAHLSPSLAYVALDPKIDPPAPSPSPLLDQIDFGMGGTTGPASLTFSYTGSFGLGTRGATDPIIFLNALGASGTVGSIGGFVSFDGSASFSDAMGVWGPPTTLLISYFDSAPGDFSGVSKSSEETMPSLPPGDSIDITGSFVMMASGTGTSAISPEFDATVPIPEPTTVPLALGAVVLVLGRTRIPNRPPSDDPL
jgi:hypothetical protein